jgi:hypothetical protein
MGAMAIAFSRPKDRCGSGPAQEMPQQRSPVVSRMEWVHTSSLKEIDTNINSCKRDSGECTTGDPGLNDRKRSVAIFAAGQGGSPREEDGITDSAQTVRRGDGRCTRSWDFWLQLLALGGQTAVRQSGDCHSRPRPKWRS